MKPIARIANKTGTLGAIVSTMACAMCFPAVASIGAAIGLGFLSHWEHLFVKVLPAFAVLVLIANAFGGFSHRQWRRSALGMVAPILVLIGWGSFMSGVLSHETARIVLYTGLLAMMAFAVWDLVSPSSHRCGPESCELPAKRG